jgi:hypothetical protein
MGLPIHPCDRTEYDRNIAGARTALGEDAFDRASADGRGISWQEAVQEALVHPEER